MLLLFHFIVCNQYLELYGTQTGLFSCCVNKVHYKGSDIEVMRAPEIHQIKWENLHMSGCTIRTKCLLSWILVLITSGASIGTIYGISTNLVHFYTLINILLLERRKRRKWIKFSNAVGGAQWNCDNRIRQNTGMAFGLF